MSSADALLSQCVLKPGFQKNYKVPVNDKSSKIIKRDKKRQEAKTKGKNWFDLPATKLTDSVRHDLDLIRMRSALDTKRFYKKNETEAYPKYFQIGTVVDSPYEGKTGRLINKERKRTMVDELLADVKFKHSTKKRNRNRSNPKLTAKIKRDNKKMKNLKKKKK
ncbi:deoxynucleotidyltransferase terminal-interacting protein 2-like isoform X2 [Sipha flava]|uniref:Deoxynucleotidyltransferase terminal-interacting protein 2-like isoform X2 n=1 Tax=Sipha flava TaxID=143950 RepID=A0A8B8F8A2_9HEMI|nr:deoxynucleotidyltransferase terminal-interacting protein 2-like isoform X2 [Sipha flava]